MCSSSNPPMVSASMAGQSGGGMQLPDFNAVWGQQTQSPLPWTPVWVSKKIIWVVNQVFENMLRVQIIGIILKLWSVDNAFLSSIPFLFSVSGLLTMVVIGVVVGRILDAIQYSYYPASKRPEWICGGPKYDKVVPLFTCMQLFNRASACDWRDKIFGTRTDAVKYRDWLRALCNKEFYNQVLTVHGPGADTWKRGLENAVNIAEQAVGIWDLPDNEVAFKNLMELWEVEVTQPAGEFCEAVRPTTGIILYPPDWGHLTNYRAECIRMINMHMSTKFENDCLATTIKRLCLDLHTDKANAQEQTTTAKLQLCQSVAAYLSWYREIQKKLQSGWQELWLDDNQYVCLREARVKIEGALQQLAGGGDCIVDPSLLLQIEAEGMVKCAREELPLKNNVGS